MTNEMRNRREALVGQQQKSHRMPPGREACPGMTNEMRNRREALVGQQQKRCDYPGDLVSG
ncbi:MAG: hypothetical protein C0408_07165 [Odoribacter sp.]|nr:hypothetical protein [Odoribacter sp.]